MKKKKKKETNDFISEYDRIFAKITTRFRGQFVENIRLFPPLKYSRELNNFPTAQFADRLPSPFVMNAAFVNLNTLLPCNPARENSGRQK